jgi:hypothetical protein
MAQLGPRDSVWVTRLTTFSFALAADAPMRIKATPDAEVGYIPEFANPRIELLGWRLDGDALRASTAQSDRVFIVDALIPLALLGEYRIRIAVTLDFLGFVRSEGRKIGTANVDTWVRAKSVPAAPGR